MRRVRVEPLDGPAPEALVHLGCRAEVLPCRVDPARGHVELPAATLRDLGLSPGQQVHIQARDGGRQVCVGPLVGVWLGPADMPRLRQAVPRYLQMAAEARVAGVVPLFFALEGIEPDANRVLAWTEQGGRFISVQAPLPDVIYDRAVFPDPADRARAGALRRRLAAGSGVALLNSVAALGKWAVCTALAFFPETAGLLPESVLFESAADLTGMAARHRQLFAKADQGSHGADVLQISAGSGGWRVRGQSHWRAVDEAFPDLEQVSRFLALLRGEDRWVLQQGIAVPEVNDRVFDLRVYAQKDGRGEWLVPLALVRWAPPGRVTANMSQGGEPLLPAAFRARAGDSLPALKRLETTATRAAQLAALAIEARFGLMGEIGLDIGLDARGRPWVFEANAKPVHKWLPGQPVPLIRYPFRYAVYLAGRRWAAIDAGLAPPRRLA